MTLSLCPSGHIPPSLPSERLCTSWLDLFCMQVASFDIESCISFWELLDHCLGWLFNFSCLYILSSQLYLRSWRAETSGGRWSVICDHISSIICKVIYWNHQINLNGSWILIGTQSLPYITKPAITAMCLRFSWWSIRSYPQWYLAQG